MKAFDLAIKKNPLYTKADVQQAVKQLCSPVESTFSQGHANLHIGNTSAGYPDSISGMEGFSRLLWGLVPLLAGDDEYDLWKLHLDGIKNGTNPEHEEYWGEISGTDQRMVEMAAFGLALALIPEKVWTPLSEQEKSNLVTWLNQINDYPAYDCNWLFFPVLVNLGLKHVGEPYDKEKIETNLNRIEEFYLAEGWYGDGIEGHSDYYVSFAIHYYSLVYAKVMEIEDPNRASLYKDRAKRFAKDFIYWFAKDGSALPYGRSMTYRFAQAAFWSALVYAEVEAFPYGVMKGLILNNLRWWFQQPIFSRDGLLTIGYRYPNLVMAENYNSPGSPYWALKTFLMLALKDGHPFWQAAEQPLPELDKLSIQEPAHLILCRQENKDHVLAFNTGHPSTTEHTHTSSKYEKFVYSNFFGFSVPRAEWGLEQGAFDSMLALSEGDNLYRVKRMCEKQYIEDGIIYSEWKPWIDVTVRTWIIPGIPWHVRVHHVDTKRKLDIAEGGFALGLEHEAKDKERHETMENECEACATVSWGMSGIKRLNQSGKPVLVYPNANTNLMYARTVIPTIKASIQPGKEWLVTAVFGEPGSKGVQENWKYSPHAEIENNKLVIYSANKVIFKKDVF